MNRKTTGLTQALMLGLSAGQQAHAFYNPAAGRWLNSDPLGELGGANLYGSIHNNRGKNSWFGNGNVVPPEVVKP